MIEKTIPSTTAQRFYDRLGGWYDLADFYGERAKTRALQQLRLAAGSRVLQVGVGPGHDHARMGATVGPQGQAIGIDLSTAMLRLMRERAGAPVYAGDARTMPVADTCFDRLYAAYILALISLADLPALLRDFRRVLRPGGSLVLVTLTEGVTFGSRLVVGDWKSMYRLSPVTCGGCRPLKLAEFVTAAGLVEVRVEVVVQLGVPSEIVSASRR